MRIALLTHEPLYPPSGGGSAEAVYLVNELVARRHEVHVFCPRVEEPEMVASRLGVRLHLFTAWQMGRYVPWRTARYLAYPMALERLVTRVAPDWKFDLLLAQHAISAVAAGRLRRRLGVPVVMNFLDCLTGFLEAWPPWLMPRPIARALLRYELSIPRRFGADGVMTVSDPLRDRFSAAGYPPERIRPIYYGYDAERFRRLPADPPAVEEPGLVVMHGSFDHHHLGPIARGAVIGVAQERPTTRFRFIGERTPALLRLLHEVRAAVPAVAAEVTGFIPYERVPRLLAEASVGITPYELSTGTHCAFVAKTVEYLGMGLAVVSTPLESAQRYYAGLEGVTFSGPDANSFAHAILDWLQTAPDRRAAMVQAARKKVAAELDWSVVCQRAADFAEQCGRRAN